MIGVLLDELLDVLVMPFGEVVEFLVGVVVKLLEVFVVWIGEGLVVASAVVMMIDSVKERVMDVNMGPSVPKANGKLIAIVGRVHAAPVVEIVVVVVDASTEHPAVV